MSLLLLFNNNSIQTALPAGTIILTSYAPTLTLINNARTSVPCGQFTIAGYQNTFTYHNTTFSRLSFSNLTITGHAPQETLTKNVFSRLPSGHIALNNFAPQVTFTGRVNTSLPHVTLSINGNAPQFTDLLVIYVRLPAKDLTLASFDPGAVSTEYFSGGIMRYAKISKPKSDYVPPIAKDEGIISALPTLSIEMFKTVKIEALVSTNTKVILRAGNIQIGGYPLGGTIAYDEERLREELEALEMILALDL